MSMAHVRIVFILHAHRVLFTISQRRTDGHKFEFSIHFVPALIRLQCVRSIRQHCSTATTTKCVIIASRLSAPAPKPCQCAIRVQFFSHLLRCDLFFHAIQHCDCRKCSVRLAQQKLWSFDYLCVRARERDTWTQFATRSSLIATLSIHSLDRTFVVDFIGPQGMLFVRGPCAAAHIHYTHTIRSHSVSQHTKCHIYNALGSIDV